jgi:phosphoglycolate phosphatase
MKILLWDIDGTLLNTDRAGMHAWVQALGEEHGSPADVNSMSPAGMTDGGIAKDAIADVLCREYSTELAASLLGRYVELLPEWLERRTNGFIHPNVVEILQAAAARSDIENALLTGNLEAGARLKLGHHSILDFFAWGAFADHGIKRRDIARHARSQAEARHGDAIEAVYVIGDTRHDIDCGKAIEARTIAVGTGPFGAEELAQFEPWWAIEHLPDAHAFLTRLDEG